MAQGQRALAAIWDQAMPTAEVTDARKASGTTDEASVDRTSLFANTEKGFDVPTGMQLKIGRLDSSTPQSVNTFFKVS